MTAPIKQSQIDTRERLLNAALHAFGSRDYDGVSTREIAEQADANISAISYHFGGKKGLYHAAVRHLSTIINSGMGEKLKSVRQGIDLASPEECGEQVCQVLNHFLENILLGEIGMYAPGIIFREQNHPSEAYPILFEKLLKPMYSILAQLVAQYRGSRPNDPEVIITVQALIGQTVIFRIGRTTLLRILKKRSYNKSTIEVIKKQLASYCLALLDAKPVPIEQE
jgi:AcrR family transcriptional regulator